MCGGIQNLSCGICYQIKLSKAWWDIFANPACCGAARRNPFFPKYFMSVGDWTWRVWNEDLRSPLLVSPYAPAYLSGGTWSPTRPGGQGQGPLFVTCCLLLHA